MIREVRNSNGKLLCLLDEKTMAIEIVHKGCKTLIRFKQDGTIEVVNASVI